MDRTPRTAAEWGRHNLQLAQDALRRFERTDHPLVASQSILDAHRYAYGAWINAVDGGDLRTASAAQGLHERVHALLIESLASSLS